METTSTSQDASQGCTSLQIHKEASDKPKILLGVTGSVAAIKVGLLAAKLKEFGDVKVAATSSAMHFIGTISEEERSHLGEVVEDATEWREWGKVGDPVQHIDMRAWADVLVIAPLSANTLAKMASGLCDNLLTCVVRAWNFKQPGQYPVLVAPAMNTNMWDSPFTNQHLSVLESLGIKVIQPVAKKLACGDIGMGAMASVETIADAVKISIANAYAARNKE
mmetsp:Transcript_3822/g.4310  ORF Transcript_3822/g.4310 Transcript_3822/m.4310 type:complete len:222 (+) Transcript_3822:85-750(+)|eukprot:CAMPEP_0197867222 /NCGR_PEP_ID=MMETSP1438-20131217/44641_1 /TAXON_ID=1461541 /ORGANISM="Pterosperma sp., Strain CCMP1384" /LENGTH=221 /DNA_ID=CAMNT_0043485857 /DNA_START=614 /DNA_END=1279 /DNA_ORIENTATION=-